MNGQCTVDGDQWIVDGEQWHADIGKVDTILNGNTECCSGGQSAHRSWCKYLVGNFALRSSIENIFHANNCEHVHTHILYTAVAQFKRSTFVFITRAPESELGPKPHTQQTQTRI